MDLSAAYRDVLVLVGTQTGNAELVADAVADQLSEVGFTLHVVDMADAVPELLSEYRQLVAVTCTWSDGTFPDNAKDFFESLVALAPDLSRVAFAVVGLGHHDYDPFFLTAAYRLDEALAGLGARRVLPVHEIDGGPTPADFERARVWALALAEALAAAAMVQAGGMA